MADTVATLSPLSVGSFGSRPRAPRPDRATRLQQAATLPQPTHAFGTHGAEARSNEADASASAATALLNRWVSRCRSRAFSGSNSFEATVRRFVSSALAALSGDGSVVDADANDKQKGVVQFALEMLVAEVLSSLDNDDTMPTSERQESLLELFGVGGDDESHGNCSTPAANSSTQRRVRRPRTDTSATATSVFQSGSERHLARAPSGVNPMLRGKSAARLVAACSFVRTNGGGKRPSVILAAPRAAFDVEVPRRCSESVTSPSNPPSQTPEWGASVTSLMMQPAPHTQQADVRDVAFDGTTEVNQYVLLQPLGAGAQGEVFLAMDTDKGELRAVKVVPRPPAVKSHATPQLTPLDAADTTAAGSPLRAARQRKREQLEREVAVMKRCRHRSVVALYEVIDDPEHDAMYLVMQYVEHGPLASVGGDGAVSRTVAPALLAHYARQLVAGLEYLHRHGVVHRDIKPENILLGQDEQVYLADFGVSELFEPASNDRGVVGSRGTLPFLAPEVLSGSGDAPGDASAASGDAVDVWALGVTLYALLYGKLPWRFTDRQSLIDSITNGEIDFPVLPSDPAMTSASMVLLSPESPQVPGTSNAVVAARDDNPLLPDPACPVLQLPPFGTANNNNHNNNNSNSRTTTNVGDNDDGDGDRSASEARTPGPLTVGSSPALDSTGERLAHSRFASPDTSMVLGFSTTMQPADQSVYFASEDAIAALRNDATAASTVDAQWRSLLQKMLVRDPRRRATLTQTRRRVLRILSLVSNASAAAACANGGDTGAPAITTLGK